jgi:phenylpyruvate tautomerase PptA (4-oxalocrotonate tautomerase family)
MRCIIWCGVYVLHRRVQNNRLSRAAAQTPTERPFHTEGNITMPVIRVTIPQGAWSKEEKASLAAALTKGLAGVAAESGKGDITQFVTVHVLEAAEGGYAVGGSVLG